MLFHINTAFVKEMFKTIDEDDDNRLDAKELLVMVSAAMETEIGADLQTAKEVLEGARDEFGESNRCSFLSYIKQLLYKVSYRLWKNYADRGSVLCFFLVLVNLFVGHYLE